VQAREELTKTYETSLNRGVVQLNEETRSLAENPLVKEISLLVAQELINKSRHDPNVAGMLNHSMPHGGGSFALINHSRDERVTGGHNQTAHY
jgi:hypothetical protein